MPDAMNRHCPFPGMDPYIERPELWSDFHDRLITYICGDLQPLLRPKYIALTQERLYVVESERPIKPDVAIIAPAPGGRGRTSSAAVLEPDAPAVFELWREDIAELLIHIVEPAANNRVVTAIEVLSPSNKSPGTGRTSYMRKREEFWSGGTNLVEIDLLRDGEPTVRLGPENRAELGDGWRYLVAVTRRWPSRQEVYAVPLERRLPRVAIPLSDDDPDVTIDLQASFEQCWDSGPYPELLRYDGPPPGELTPKELTWCRQTLIEAGQIDQPQ
jgi:hypothetical protein